MAEVKAMLKKTKRRSAAQPIRVIDAGRKPRTSAKKAPAKKSALDEVYDALDLSGPDDEPVDGEKCLRSKMNRLIEKRSIEIAKRLGQKAEEGNVTSAKLILALVSKDKQLKKPFTKALHGLVGTLESDSGQVKPETQRAEKS